MEDHRGLWRGKRVDNGEWVTGDLLRDDISDVAAIVTYVNLSGDVRDLSEINIFQVIPETLGECTGFTSRNGTLVFEGDILKWDSIDLGVVRFGGYGFYHNQLNHMGFYVLRNSWQRGMYWGYPSNSVEVSEIIGNIHDNPELARKIESIQYKLPD